MGDSFYRYRGPNYLYADDDDPSAPGPASRTPLSLIKFLIWQCGQVLKEGFLWVSGTPRTTSDFDVLDKEPSRPRGMWSKLRGVGTWILRLIVLPVYLLWVPIRKLFGLHHIVRNLRETKELQWGLPALVMALVALVFGVLLQGQSRSLAKEYRYAAIRATEINNMPAAELFLQRLMRLNTDDEQMQFNYARMLESKGLSGRATAIISNLAPTSEAGYPPAHLWEANRILKDPEATDDELRSCRHHLRIAQQELGGRGDVHAALAEYHLYLARADHRDSNLEIALEHLEIAAADQPELYYRLALVQEEFNELEAAAESYTTAERHLRLAVERDQHNHDARIGLAGSLIRLSRFEEARRVLEEGMAIDPTQPFNKLLSEAIVLKFDGHLQAGDASDAELFPMLIEAMRINPKSVSAASRLMHYGVSADDVDNRELAIQGLESFLAEGEGVAMAHLLLGIHYFNNESDLEASMLHLKAAYALDETLTDSANNFAWLLAHQDPPDYERALLLIDSILAEQPDNPNYLDTRGHIYLGLGRLDEAFRDLERALPGLKNNANTHYALARIYTHYGQSNLADKHQSMADSLRIEQGLHSAD